MPDRLPHFEDRGACCPSITPAPSPRRITRPRKRGYRTPPGVVYVGRPTIWANPFRAERFGHARSCRLYRRWLTHELGAMSLEALGFSPHEIDALGRWRRSLLRAIPKLAGRTLQCWCPVTSKWCHADILLAFANGGRT